MKKLTEKYADKLVRHGLAAPGAPLVGGLDDELVWNREDERTAVLAQVFDALSINSLVFSRPAEPYFSIIEQLCRVHSECIEPRDCETRTFLHDLPICREFTAEAIIAGLKKRKAVIVPGEGIISWGTVSPEQGFVFFSSVCFACFVLYFSDHLEKARRCLLSQTARKEFDQIVAMIPPPPAVAPSLRRGPFTTADDCLSAMDEAGKAVVNYGLVDSFFGNISCLHENVVHISQTGSSLDELAGCIDPCPLDGSSCAGLTASSEFTAHADVYRRTDARVILHGHPRFSVIMSMVCDTEGCPNEGQCHIKCSQERSVADALIVPGEVGTGPTGLCNTLPPALVGHDAAIVYGHGVFTTDTCDFNAAFARLLDVEKRARNAYFRRLAESEG